MFDILSSRLGVVFERLRGKGRLSEADVAAALGEVRLALLEADVNLEVVKRFLDRVGGRAVGAEVRQSLTPGQQVIKIVHDELVTTLGSAAAPLAVASRPPLVILVAGLQGSGKTTTAAKLAERLRAQGKHPLLVAADLQRPAAIDQLEVLGERIGVPVHADRRGKPERLVREARQRAETEGLDAVVIDTAGRLQVDAALMTELAAVRKAAEPHEVLLVLDAMTGQEAVAVARGFLEKVAVTGLVLTKLDGDARGGAAISAREVTGCPIKFVGVGEGSGDLEVFHPERMASRILGMGDVMTLIEKAETEFSAAEAAEAAEKLRTASFTFEDFLSQFQQLRRMGGMGQLLGMLPGAATASLKAGVSDADLGRVEAIIRSMTPDERRNPKIIDGSRKRRIALGSGATPQDVNGLMRQFGETQKMMKALAEGRSPLPGLALPGARRTRKR
jgi:signal recognition particle subunit SRP54